MKIPFYQSKWFDINLSQLAASLGHDKLKMADEHIYEEAYKQLLKDKNQEPSSEWVEKKHRLSQWLSQFLRDRRLENASILSIGSGLGVVEQPLIKNNFSIDLQECQSISIDYFKKNHPDEYKKTKIILSLDLKSIENDSYDVVMAITSTYGLDDKTLVDFFESVSRVLKKDGIFIFYETTLTFSDIRNKIKKIILNQREEGLLWGWKRSQNEFLKIAKKVGFLLGDRYYFDRDNYQIDSKFWVNGYYSNAVWEMMIFKNTY